MSAAAFLYVIATVVLAEQRQNHGEYEHSRSGAQRIAAFVSRARTPRANAPASRQNDAPYALVLSIVNNLFPLLLVLVFDGREPVKSKSLVKLEIRRKGIYMQTHLISIFYCLFCFVSLLQPIHLLFLAVMSN